MRSIWPYVPVVVVPISFWAFEVDLHVFCPTLKDCAQRGQTFIYSIASLLVGLIVPDSVGLLLNQRFPDLNLYERPVTYSFGVENNPIEYTYNREGKIICYIVILLLAIFLLIAKNL